MVVQAWNGSGLIPDGKCRLIDYKCKGDPSVKITRSGEYEEMAASFQCFQIQTLYETLKKHGIKVDQARKICEDFVFQQGVAMDQFWIESEKGKVFPVIGFSRKHPDCELEDLFLNNGFFSFHEYAFGNVSWFFEENDPDKQPQKYGPVGDGGLPE